MARKAKVAPVVASTNEAGEVTQVEVGGKVLDVIDMGPVVEEVAAEAVGSSLLSQALAQIQQDESTKVEEVVEKVKSDKNDGVGIFIKNLINDGLGNKDILKIVHEQYGNKNTTYACVAWYRNKMKKTGAVQAKSSALDFINNFAKTNGLSEEAVETLKTEFKVA